MKQTGLEKVQITNWFTNTRKRDKLYNNLNKSKKLNKCDQFYNSDNYNILNYPLSDKIGLDSWNTEVVSINEDPPIDLPINEYIPIPSHIQVQF